MLAINNYRNDRERCEYSRQDGRRTYHEHDDHLQFCCLFDRNTAKDGSGHRSRYGNYPNHTVCWHLVKGGGDLEGRETRANLIWLMTGVSDSLSASRTTGLQASARVAPKARYTSTLSRFSLERGVRWGGG